MSEQETPITRNPADYLKMFFRRKWLFAGAGYVGLMAGIFAALLLPPKYQSSTVILVEEEKVINPLIEGLAVSTNLAQRMRNIREQILSWTSLLELTKKLNLARSVQNQQQFEDLIMGLRKNIDVKVRGTNLVQIVYTGSNPKETQLIAQTITDVLIEENIKSQSRETDVAINFIQDQLAVYKRKIKESEIAEIEDKLNTLLADSTEAHPLVKDLRTQLNIQKKELETGQYEVKIAGTEIKGEVYDELRKELDQITVTGKAPTTGPLSYAYGDKDAAKGEKDPTATMYKLMVLDKLDASMARDMKVNENIYNLLLQKLETAKITQRLEVSKEGTRYRIIDPARLPLKAAKPDKLLITLMGLFGGLAIGVGLIFIREFMDQSVLDIEDAKRTFDLPILGAISRLTTQEEIEMERQKRKKITIAFSGFSGALLIIALLIALFKR
jgi:polysaccharide biosynthesis transport protein